MICRLMFVDILYCNLQTISLCKKVVDNSLKQRYNISKGKGKASTGYAKECYLKKITPTLAGGRYFFMDAINAINVIMKIMIYTERMKVFL